MSTKPLTYDDITRRTVLEPDGSIRPTREQEAAAYQGFRATTPSEQALHAHVTTTLANFSLGGTDLSGVVIEIDGERAIVRGTVRDASLLVKVEDLIRSVEGIAAVDNHLVVGAS